ncbi:hypothetical protein ACFX2J_028490 [Malus domestica]
MDGTKPCTTPLGSTKLDLTGSLLDNPEEYRSIVGALQYLTWTRPDLSFSVNLVCQFMHSPQEPHFQAVKCILRYLKGTLGYGIWFPKTRLLSLSKHILMLIGQDVPGIDVPLGDFASFLDPPSLVGVPRSNTLLLVHPPKLNIGHWLILLLN